MTSHCLWSAAAPPTVSADVTYVPGLARTIVEIGLPGTDRTSALPGGA
jgi:hypothetical protein